MAFSILKNSRDFVSKKQETILSGALVFIIATTATKLIGIIKLVLLANMFGTSRSLDMFYAANTLPEIIFTLLVTGSINTAIIPVFSKFTGKKSDEFNSVFSKLFTFASLLLSVLALIGIVFAPFIVKALVDFGISKPTPPFNAFEFAEMSEMIRILFISPFILGLSFILTGILMVHKRFIITQIASVMYSLGFILSIFIFVPFFGVIGLCWGVVLGSVFHLIVQLPVIKMLGIDFKFDFNFKNNYLIEMLRLFSPRVLGLLGEQLSVLVDTILAIGLISGSLSAFKYAYTIYLIPVVVVGLSIAQAAFPVLVEEYSLGKIDSFKKNFSKSLQQILFFSIPLAIIITVLRLPLVRLLGIGKDTMLGWDGTLATAWVLFFFGLNIIFQSVIALLIRGFYAMQNTKVPLRASLITVIVNLFLSIYLVKVFGNFSAYRGVIGNFMHINLLPSFVSGSNGWMAVGGLSLASTITSFIVLIYMGSVFKKSIGGLKRDEFKIPLIKKVVSGGVMGIAMYGVYILLDSLINTSHTIELIFLIAIVCYVGISVYIFLAYFLEDEESELISKIAGKIKNILLMKENVNVIQSVTQ